MLKAGQRQDGVGTEIGEFFYSQYTLIFFSFLHFLYLYFENILTKCINNSLWDMKHYLCLNKTESKYIL